jgi:signal transduction histidine kinase
MRIRSKISILYTQLTFSVLLIAFALVYTITARRSERGFYDALWERAMLTAQLNFAREGMSDFAYRNLQEQHQFALNDERTSLFSADDTHVGDSLKKVIPREWLIEQIRQGKTIEYGTGQRQYIGIYYPARSGNHIVVVSAFDKLGADSRKSLFRLLAVILVAASGLVYLIGLRYAERVLEPIREIIDDVKRITASNLRRSLRPQQGNDELSELSRTFNEMIERLRASFDMQNSFIRNASHELRNPLTAILGEAEIALGKTRTPQQYEQTLTTVLFESERLKSMIDDLLLLAQTDFDFSRVPRQSLDLRTLIEEIAGELHRTHPRTAIEVQAPPGVSCEITAVPSLLGLALLNLIGNAAKFSHGSPVTVTLGAGEGRIRVAIADRGIGIPARELQNIFQPFYRGSNTAGYTGTGIGLPMARRIVELHGGRLRIESMIGEGTTVTIEWGITN